MNAIEEKTNVHTLDEVFLMQKKNALLMRKESPQKRKERLQKIQKWIHANRKEIHQVMFLDFQKAAQEVDAIEIFHVLNEIKLALANVDTWASSKKVDAPLTLLGTRSYIQFEAKGVCLIISPWNYPFSLAVGPLVSAIAAGNTVILKPSEMTPNVSSLIKTMVESLFSVNEIALFEGGPEVSQRLLKLPFDHIFFTGSPAIGRVVMKAASEHLSSVTLELGGKSPTFVTADANINDAAERIAVGKFVNNGQTCVAPDYLLVDEKIQDKLVDAVIKKTKQLFAGKEESLEKSLSYCRIVNDKHFSRLSGLVEDAVLKGAKVSWNGEHNKATRFFHPVILTDVAADAKLLEEEIFGPVLPIIAYKNLSDAIDFVNKKPKPLALYIFSSKGKIQNEILSSTSAGGVCINDCGIHFLHHNLPFGGISNSGIGKSHGYFGFLAFSHEKPVLKQKSGLTTFRLFYPPYTVSSGKLMDWFLKFF
jgi:aldehyde dehydrogenase (NAD+)